ncbi:phytanoyl-CoA dioxygenase family protein [Blastococcus sp. BMG 814]|uniref:Phytanoyl-CoA dioxygenase family protein n=1 Tax=Blastococcus carthaginiensis TaxID=3050034 RepID=A0ABT9I9U1_9ACTN|nr:phytanoyl-CoA dioxygenase family protein [Blastococcus carthaginiensis]MDP5182331.1 phytanoyl-CoA dioxygenase family protein [Blastococcus carthaginiensis]
MAERPTAAEAAASLRDDGFVVLRGGAAGQVRQLADDLATLSEQAAASRDDGSACPSGWHGTDGSLWSADRRALTQLQLTYRTSAAMLSVACEPQVLNVLEHVLGPAIELFGEGQAFVKAPESGTEKHWHQDEAFFRHAGPGQFAALVYVQDTTVESGALHVVPGSHLGGLRPHDDSDSHLALDVRTSDAVAVEGAAGDILIFGGLLLHGSPGNRSGRWRHAAVNRYRRAGDHVTETGTTASTMHPVDVPFGAPGSGAGHEGLLVRGTRPLRDAPGWAWPVWQQRVFPA